MGQPSAADGGRRAALRGLSLRALARQVGLTGHGTLVDYEHGRRIPPQHLVMACEKALDIRDGYLRDLRKKALAEQVNRESALSAGGIAMGGDFLAPNATDGTPSRGVVMESVVTERLGALPVAAEFLRRLHVAGSVDGLRPPAPRADLMHGRVIEALVANRLTAPALLFRVGDWAYSCEAVKGLGGGRCVSRMVH